MNPISGNKLKKTKNSSSLSFAWEDETLDGLVLNENHESSANTANDTLRL